MKHFERDTRRATAAAPFWNSNEFIAAGTGRCRHWATVVLLALFAAMLPACSILYKQDAKPPPVAAVVTPAPPPPAAMPAPAPPPPPSPAAGPGPAAVPPAPPEMMEPRGKTVKLWYGTNRKPTDPFVRFDPYGATRDHKLNFGVCEVLVPKSHKRGSLGSYSVFAPDSDAPLVFTHAKQLGELQFWNDLATALAAISSKDKVVLVFIHGYNNTFKDAAIRTAQLWADLNLNGVPAFFSWPSRGSTVAYPADEATIDYSEKYLEEFLLRLRAEVGREQPIHVIAHSMGNRALLRVAAKLRDRVRFGQVILAAPDLDVDVFLELADAYSAISERTTLYVSRRDKAVNFSKQLHDMDRVGAPPAFANVDQVDTIEVVAKTGLLNLGHSYFAEFSELLDDMADLLARNPRRGTSFKGTRVDTHAQCRYSGGAMRTSESCWRILVKN